MAGTIMDDTEEFINSIEKSPALYLKSLKEYSDNNLRKMIWEEVCMEAVQKWLNLRTCFSRELKAQKTTSGQAAKKRRKYRYFEKLLFLKYSLAERPTDGNLDSTAAEDEDETETSDNMSSNVPIR
nr:uncharacterized protein LOC111514001 [Leptinotarsa decemlineata]